MIDKRRTRVRTLYIVLVAYVILFSGWWTYLLLSKNADVYGTKIELLKAELANENLSYLDHMEETIAYQDIIIMKNRQRNMIIAEGIVFFVILMIGVWFVYKSFKQEMKLAAQQRNFLLSITHELKSPIASIRLILDTFIKRNLKQEQIQRFAKNGVKEATRLLRLVNNILLAARLESGFHMSKGDVDLKVLIRDIVDQLQDKHPNTLFSLQMDKVVPMVQADTVALTSIALNLLENAVKYCPSDTPIDVTIKHEHNNIILEVADEGAGIPDTEKSKIFEKFYRVGNEDTRTTKGTGLGLFLVQSLITEHDGSISVKDNKPTGTIFSVKFPATMKTKGFKMKKKLPQG